MENENNKLLRIENKEIFQQIADVAKQYAEESFENQFIKPVILANAVALLQKRMSDEFIKGISKTIMGTRLGFKTDGKAYDTNIIRNCMIEAALNGFYWTGNEFL